jgi:hypothetical protein
MAEHDQKRLMEAAFNSPHERARLMIVSSKNASDWLNCLPLPSLGLKLNPSQLKIASALRLGAPVCRSFKCFYCSNEVSSLGRHGLHYNEAVAWDFTCSDTLAPSNIKKYSMEAGKTATWAEENKFTTYGNALRDDYHFV